MKIKRGFPVFLYLIFSVMQAFSDDYDEVPEKGIPVLIYHKIPLDNSEAPAKRSFLWTFLKKR